MIEESYVSFDTARMLKEAGFDVKRNIDIFWHIEQKIKYNELRPYKHGGRTY